MTIKEKVGSLKGIGPKKEEALKNAGIETLEDLVYFFPRSYEDRRTVSTLRDAELYKDVLISLTVICAYNDSRRLRSLYDTCMLCKNAVS